MKREVVYHLIDGERNYQDGMGPERTDGIEKSVGDYLTLLRVLCARADEAYYKFAGNHDALEQVRKIAAVAVRCMEEHGAPERIDIGRCF